MGPCIAVDRRAISANLARFRACHTAVFAVVKADAYGHGLAPTVGACAAADGFCVARAEEALAVRALSDCPVLLLGRADESELDALVAADVTLAVTDAALYAALVRSAARQGRRARALVKIDGGMHRYGMTAAQLRALPPSRWVAIEGCFSHVPDEERWESAAAACAATGLATAHVAATGCAHRTRGAIRLGLGLYGYGADGLTPAMRVTTKIVAVRDVPAGETVGYGAYFRAERDMRAAVAAVGYGDGFPRVVNRGYMTVRGRRCPIVGAVCMDATLLDVTDTGACVGDTVVVLDDAADAARALGTIPYCLLSGWTKRPERTFF